MSSAELFVVLSSALVPGLVLVAVLLLAVYFVVRKAVRDELRAQQKRAVAAIEEGGGHTVMSPEDFDAFSEALDKPMSPELENFVSQKFIWE